MRVPQSQTSTLSAEDAPGASASAAERAETISSSPAPFTVVLDDRGRVVSFNDAFARTIQLGAKRIHGQSFVSLVIPEGERPAFAALLQRARDGSDGHARVNSWLTTSGERRQVQWSLTCLEEKPEKCSAFIITGIDLSSNLERWEQIAEREARLKSILDTAVDGIVTIDEEGKIESVNLATERIFGYQSSELIGRNVKILMPDPYRMRHDSYVSNYLNTGAKKIIGTGREVEGRRKDGSTFPLDLAVSEFHVAGRRRFMGLMRDVSARKRAEQEARHHLNELAHASRLLLLGEMVTGIAHEVNQPLAAIVSYAQACLNMLSSKDADDAVLKDALSQITTQGRRAGDIIHHLRQLVRKDQTTRTNINVNACLRAVLNLFSQELESSGIDVTLELEESIPQVKADRVQIEQVLLNLIRNALDVLSKQPHDSRRVRLATSLIDDDRIEVSISDTGPGLEGEDPERLFETFYTTKSDGLGVGLSISRSIINAHGGRLWAKENRTGGLSVCFTLPTRGGNG